MEADYGACKSTFSATIVMTSMTLKQDVYAGGPSHERQAKADNAEVARSPIPMRHAG
jgi:hypothetical protein